MVSVIIASPLPRPVDVLGFGVISVDDLLTVERYPAVNTRADVLAWHRSGGGLTATALVAASRLGASAAYCGVLGDDELSRWAIESLESEGVDCSAVLRRPGARPTHGVIIVERDTGQRTIFLWREGVMERLPEDLPEELITRCRVLFVDHMVPRGGLYASRIAHRYGIPVVGDLDFETKPGVADLMREVDHLIVGIDMARRVTGEADPAVMAQALAVGRACAVVTAGERGSWYSERGAGAHHVPAFRVQVVDTTGCGDVFHGAYAACLARGENVAMAVLVATAAAALKATQPGGRAGIPTREVVDRFLQATGTRPSPPSHASPAPG